MAEAITPPSFRRKEDFVMNAYGKYKRFYETTHFIVEI
jgi:hypothetical protein